MSRETIYELWAPAGLRWSPWVKPVLFAHIGQTTLSGPVPVPDYLPDWLPRGGGDTAVVVDLPGAESVLVGLALAQSGCQPVPLFNGNPGPSNAARDVKPIIALLEAGSDNLQERPVPADAPPAFLIDYQRTSGQVSPGSFDNRWIVLPQDFPSGSALRNAGIVRVVLLQPAHEVRPLATDLAHVLLRWQEAGLVIEQVSLDAGAVPQPLQVPRPSWYRSVWYRLRALASFRRSFAGGFGGNVPYPSQGGSSFG